MKTIWKYEITADDYVTIEMPRDAEILSVQVQNDKPCIWALVDTDNTLETYRFEIYGTGHDLIDCANKKYRGTFQLHNGALAFHLFELLF